MSDDKQCNDPNDCCNNDPCTKDEPKQADQGGCCGGGSSCSVQFSPRGRRLPHFFEAIMKKVDVNKKLIERFTELYPDIVVLAEHRPFKLLWEESDTDKKIREWLKSHNYNDFRLDFYLPEYRFYVEIQGSGYGHTGKGQLRDYKKHNDLLMVHDMRGLYLTAFQIKDNVDHYCKQIFNYIQTIDKG